MRRRPLPAALTALAAFTVLSTALLAGCAQPAPVAAPATSRTSAAPTPSRTFVPLAAGPADPMLPVFDRIHAAVQRAGTGRFASTSDRGSLNCSFTGTALDCTGTMPALMSGVGDLHAIDADGRTYVETPGSLRDVVHTPWVTLADARTSRAVPAPAGTDTSRLIAFLGQLRFNLTFTRLTPPGMTTLRARAQDLVDGRGAQRYDLITDLTQAGQQNNADGQAIATDPSTLWVAADDLPVRIRSSVQLAYYQAIGRDPDTRFRDWGGPVTITPPPADQVTAIR